MTERLSEVTARIEGIRQLGAIVNAMRGIAAARAQLARGQLSAVDRYAATVAAAIGRTVALMPPAGSAETARSARPAVVLFCAEQGFAGAFSERVLDAAAPDLGVAELFLVGTRGRAVAAERGVVAGWNSTMPASSLGIPRLADRIAEALYARIATAGIDRLDAVFGQWQPGAGVHVARRRLFPLDLSAFPPPAGAEEPRLNLAPETLMFELTAGFVHAQLCSAALHAFAAENEARIEAMASARGQIERSLALLLTTQHIVRQGEITAEIIELAAGETASRPVADRGTA